MAPRETFASSAIIAVVVLAYPCSTKQRTAASRMACRVSALFSACQPSPARPERPTLEGFDPARCVLTLASDFLLLSDGVMSSPCYPAADSCFRSASTRRVALVVVTPALLSKSLGSSAGHSGRKRSIVATKRVAQTPPSCVIRQTIQLAFFATTILD